MRARRRDGRSCVPRADFIPSVIDDQGPATILRPSRDFLGDLDHRVRVAGQFEYPLAEQPVRVDASAPDRIAQDGADQEVAAGNWPI